MARPRRHTTCATVLAALMLGACTSTGSAPPPTLPSAPQLPSTSASSASPEDQAKEAAKATIEKYYSTIPRCLADPVHAPTNCFDNVAIATELDDLINALKAARQVQSKTSGSIAILRMDLLRVDLTNKVTETPPTVPLVTYRVCVDVTDFSIVDRNANSIVPATRAARSNADLTVVNYHFPDQNQWRVAYQVTSSEPC